MKNDDKNNLKSLLKKSVAVGLVLMSKRDRIENIFSKIYDSQTRKFRFQTIKYDVKIFGRMIKNFFKGEYKHLSPWIFINTIVGFSYLFLNADLIPDKIKNLGFVDDLAMLALVFNSYGEEIRKFEMWEATQKVMDLDVKIV